MANLSAVSGAFGHAFNGFAVNLKGARLVEFNGNALAAQNANVFVAFYVLAFKNRGENAQRF